MRVYVADAHVHVQRLVSVVKMATVLEECTTEQQRFITRVMLVNGRNIKDIHKEIFSVYGGK
jgi:wyosine [tRNA(Phe)-imidazoG37] synthetase (radical SAM superfamily)